MTEYITNSLRILTNFAITCSRTLNLWDVMVISSTIFKLSEKIINMNNKHHNIVRRYQINTNDFDYFYFCPHFYEAFKKNVQYYRYNCDKKLWVKRSPCLLQIVPENLHSTLYSVEWIVWHLISRSEEISCPISILNCG